MFWRESGAKLVANLAVYRQTKSRPGLINKIRSSCCKFSHICWTLVTFSDIHREAVIHKNTRFPHPNGIVIHQDAVIGDHCLIMQQVTLGQTAEGGAPTLGDGVYIGAGAKLLGKITIGNNTRIGANAVVLADVPENCTAVGIPARIIKRGD